jgi:hypothetical protein
MNHLEHETSPYLLQHRLQPIDWYPWDTTALAKAKRENKLILLSIGYSTCHWCHVMAKESFDDPDVAAFQNTHFINIKVDREERPDLDAFYMEALEVLTGDSGWPLNIFLTPDLKPFFGGTYFPPNAMPKRMSWFQALQYALYNFNENRSAVENQANRALARLGNREPNHTPSNPLSEQEATIKEVYNKIKARFDTQNGGFGSGKKFPNTMALEFLLNYHFLYKDDEALDHLKHSINAMLQGGIYDQIGGGIARYSVDPEWRVPHFEKMLYDNALLIQLLSKTHMLTGRRKHKTAVIHIIEFLDREMRQANGAYSSAIDADGEQGEGRYYTWKKSEIEAVLGDEAAIFSDFYGVTENGNWQDGQNILYQPHDRFSYADEHGIEREALLIQLREAGKKLLKARLERPSLHIDQKVILAWNAMMVSALVNAFQATVDDTYLNKAQQTLQFLLDIFKSPNGLCRIFHKGQCTQKATLRDYAFLIRALLDVYSISGDRSLLEESLNLEEEVNHLFSEADSPLFCFTNTNLQDMVYPYKDIKDEDMPSGNALMVGNLQELGILLDRKDLRQKAYQMLQAMQTAILDNPLAYASWTNMMLAAEHGLVEIAVVGPEAEAWSIAIAQQYIPFKIIVSSTKEENDFPLLAGKKPEAATKVYVCQDYSCKRPLSDLESFFREHTLKSFRDEGAKKSTVVPNKYIKNEQ